MTTKNKHIGSSFASFQEEEAIEAVVAEIIGGDNLHDALYYDHIEAAASLILAARRERDLAMEGTITLRQRALKAEAERDAALESLRDMAHQRGEAHERVAELEADVRELTEQGAANRRLRAAVEYAVEQDRDNTDWSVADCFCHIVAALRNDGGK